MKTQPGSQIQITIGGVSIMTTIDQYGVQRLPSNLVYNRLFKSGIIDLNALKSKYLDGRISFEDYLELHLNLGYSVCGFAELSCFEHLKIINPLWE